MNQEQTYRVIWEIDVSANTPREAAQKALAIQRNPESTATIFKIDLGKTIDGVSLEKIIDLGI